MTNIVYMGVARVPNKQILVSCVAVESKEQTIKQLDAKLSRVLEGGRVDQHDRLTIADKDVGSIHYEADPALLYLVITAQSYPQRTAFKLLSEAKTAFESEFKDELAKGKGSVLSKVGQPFLQRMMDKYEDVSKADKLASVSVQVDQVKGIMQSNIQAALKNQENLETLLDSSDAMRNEASTFNRSTRAVKERMRWKNLKLGILVFVLLLAAILIIVIPVVVKREKAGA